ncbi:MAG: hypothetical protein D6797_09010 [Bdellovibrio sp.]|nr:MAG: hypothetical protein D6797_09010 [Bdellovibrio sp.]
MEEAHKATASPIDYHALRWLQDKSHIINTMVPSLKLYHRKSSQNQQPDYITRINFLDPREVLLIERAQKSDRLLQKELAKPLRLVGRLETLKKIHQKNQQRLQVLLSLRLWSYKQLLITLHGELLSIKASLGNSISVFHNPHSASRLIAQLQHLSTLLHEADAHYLTQKDKLLNRFISQSIN